MNALREVAQNSYALVDANAAQAAALNRLQLRVDPDLIDAAVDISLEGSGVDKSIKPAALGDVDNPAMGVASNDTNAAAYQAIALSALPGESPIAPAAADADAAAAAAAAISSR